jgi:hypothetical protein
LRGRAKVAPSRCWRVKSVAVHTSKQIEEHKQRDKMSGSINAEQKNELLNRVRVACDGVWGSAAALLRRDLVSWSLGTARN